MKIEKLDVILLNGDNICINFWIKKFEDAVPNNKIIIMSKQSKTIYIILYINIFG